MIDERTPNPTADHKAQFLLGWHEACDDKQYGDNALAKLTWRNLGWRLGRTFGQTSDALMSKQYEWCVDHKSEGGSVVFDE